MLVFERALHKIAKSHMRRDPIKVRCVDTWNSSGIHRRRLMAKEFREGSRCEAFANFSALPPLELVKMMLSMVAMAQKGQGSWYGEQNVAGGDEIVMMHTDISRSYFHAPSKEEEYLELPGGKWTSNYTEKRRLRVSVYGTRDAQEHHFRIVVRGDHFLLGGPRRQLEWVKTVMNKHFLGEVNGGRMTS